jgi:hypothetical protein
MIPIDQKPGCGARRQHPPDIVYSMAKRLER